MESSTVLGSLLIVGVVGIIAGPWMWAVLVAAVGSARTASWSSTVLVLVGAVIAPLMLLVYVAG